jgi:hypothetical protein
VTLASFQARKAFGRTQVTIKATPNAKVKIRRQRDLESENDIEEQVNNFDYIIMRKGQGNL